MGSDWSDYLADFHAARPGVTDAVLATTIDETGRTPYAWLVEALPTDGGSLLDLAAGSGVVSRTVPPRWSTTSLDRSAAEAALASATSAHVLVGDATALPFADHSFDAVTCSMALMLLPWDGSLDEIARVLRPGGTFVATVPTGHPLTLGDVVHYGRLLAALRARLHYPNDDALTDARSGLAAHGFDVVEDSRSRFELVLVDRDTARTFLGSLYLPGIADARVAAATQVVDGWADDAVRIGLPIRRIVARLGGHDEPHAPRS